MARLIFDLVFHAVTGRWPDEMFGREDDDLDPLDPGG